MSESIDAEKLTASSQESSAQPAWLLLVDSRIEEEDDGLDFISNAVFFRIIRDLLLAPDDDSAAVSQAIKKFEDNYLSSLTGEDLGGQAAPEYGAGDELNAISLAVLETVVEVPFTDTKHDQLAELLVGIKNSAAEEFDTSNPRFVYFDSGLSLAVRESWNASHAESGMPYSEDRPLVKLANEWLSISALLAKLYRGGLLHDMGPVWIFDDLEDALETRTRGDIAIDLGRQAQVLATANYILIAGESVVKEVKKPSRKYEFELSAARWRLWAMNFQQAANAASEESGWDLKNRIQKAHDKMVELYPEAFE
ncbi:hypothetical protein FDECE_5841 [Fusarium decemcellulare]|nr:hypothetical protein FDECE_5841 [Fusarium decemcellulare]